MDGDDVQSLAEVMAEMMEEMNEAAPGPIEGRAGVMIGAVLAATGLPVETAWTILAGVVSSTHEGAPASVQVILPTGEDGQAKMLVAGSGGDVRLFDCEALPNPEAKPARLN